MDLNQRLLLLDMVADGGPFGAPGLADTDSELGSVGIASFNDAGGSACSSSPSPLGPAD